MTRPEDPAVGSAVDSEPLIADRPAHTFPIRIPARNCLADDLSERAQYKGMPEGTITGASKPSNYFILVKDKGDFVAVPVDQWVTFRYSAVNRKFDAQSLEEAEAAMKYRRVEAEKQDVVSLVKLGDLEKQGLDAKAVRGKAGTIGKGKKTQGDRGKKVESDSEDEWKDVKAEKLKKRNMIMVTDDGLGIERQSTALDFKDEYKPKNAEDWEHEVAADDDDVDMGDDEMLDDDLVVPGFGAKRGLQSPSVSGGEAGGLDGDLSDGGMADTSLRRKIQRTLTKRIGEGSDDDGAAAEDDLSDDEDDDVDALDAMASGDFMPVAANTSGAVRDAANAKDKSIDATDHDKKKRKIEEKPAAPSEKKAKLVDTGVPSEDEIRSLLHHKKRMLLADIAAEFKKRLKNAEDRKTFTRRVGAVAMLDPGESGKKRHLILKPE